MDYQTYVFDLDGTLLDTLGDLAASTNYALAANGMPTRTVEEVRLFVGNGVKKLMERAVPDGQANPRFEETMHGSCAIKHNYKGNVIRNRKKIIQ